MNKNKILQHYLNWVHKNGCLDPEPDYEMYNDKLLVKMIHDLFELKTRHVYEKKETLSETEILNIDKKEFNNIPTDLLGIIYDYSKYTCPCGKETDNDNSICNYCVSKGRKCMTCNEWSHPKLLCYICSNAETEYMYNDDI